VFAQSRVLQDVSERLGVFGLVKRAAVVDESGGSNAAAGNTAAAGWLGKGSDATSMCVGAEPSVCACGPGHAQTKDVATKRRFGACGSRPTCQPCYKHRTMHTKNKGQTRTRKVCCAQSPSLFAGLTKSARMHKHRFSSVQSHLFLSLIGARTLKMPVPYSPPSVGAYTRTPSHQPLVFGRRGTDHLP